MSMPDPFEGHGIKQVIPRQALLIIAMAGISLDDEPTMVIFPTYGGVANPWITFDIGERRFGIWLATMHLYEADKHGAMGTDIVDPAMIPKTRG